MRTLCLLLAGLLPMAALAASDTRTDHVLIMGIASGTQVVETGADGMTRAEYSYSDRGRGDHIIAKWKLDAAGVPVEYTGKGNDYMKAPVDESFTLADGHARWNNRSEEGTKDVDGEAFYVPANPPPEFTAVLARALLQAPDHRLPLLPAGEAHIAAAGSVTADGRTLTQYRISGLGFTPTPVWLDADGATGAIVSSWFSILPGALEKTLPKLAAAQQQADNAWAADIASHLTHAPAGALVIEHARLFDPRDLTVTPGTSVLVEGERVVRIAADGTLAVPAGAEIVDAHGRFLMPGLWDDHQHFGDTDGPLDLANGVTSARDMANNTDSFLDRVARFDAGTELGPRVLKAGVIDGKGKFAGPTRMLVDNAKDAIADVNWYADHGYVQIKIYSSVDPKLVPVIADAAHARGLRVSGHVPAFMSARQFVEGGADEIQHLNFIELDFLWPKVQETRNRNRFIAVAEHAHEFTPTTPVVADFIAFLKRHHTVLDPTVNVFEGLFCGDPSAVTPGLEAIAPRFPPQVRRRMLSGALEVPEGHEAAWREAFPSMLKLLKALHDAGVTIIPGTDELAGYTLHHELALYVRAGIPAPEVLRMATLTPARVMGVTRDLGAIAPGKLADMILVDGDPATDIGDLDRIDWVMKGGKTYDPAAIEHALGIAPRGS
jgi:imidazolonepropionase-like amidohydrolase